MTLDPTGSAGANAHDSRSVYRELRERIAVLAYPPGTTLSENRLAEEFGLSRTPIRRALHRLEFDGLVSVQRGVGTIVTAVDMMYLKQVYALRLKLTDLIAELAPARVSDAELAALRALHEEALTMRDDHDPERLARIYLRFNESVTLAIGHQPLREIADRLFYQTSRVWLQALPGMDWDEEVCVMGEEMRDTIHALAAEDMVSVAEVRRRHLIGCIHRVNHYLGSFDLSSEP